jgi:formylglycine-generating enzyme required for sulfatase activity
MKKIAFLAILWSAVVFCFAQTVPDNMVLINGGTFVMGSPFDEAGRSDDEVQHRVTVSSFYMGKHKHQHRVV